LEVFFTHWIEENHLIDLEPPKLSQTWRNGRKGEYLVAKRLDRFLISEDLLENPWTFKSWVVVGGMFDHMSHSVEYRKKRVQASFPNEIQSSLASRGGL
jgi:hypothetical protein